MSRSQDDIQIESERLTTLLSTLHYYRYRDYIYDPFRYKPLFTVEEYVWTFTKYPQYSKNIINNLNNSLKDVPTLKEPSLDESSAIISKYLTRANNSEISKMQQMIEISNIFRFLSERQIWKVYEQQHRFKNVVKQKLIEFEPKWPPANVFYKKLFPQPNK